MKNRTVNIGRNEKSCGTRYRRYAKTADMMNWPSELERPKPGEALTAQEAADLIVTRPSLTTVYALMNNGTLPAIRIGGRIVTSRAAIDWMTAHAARPKVDAHAEAMQRLRQEGLA